MASFVKPNSANNKKNGRPTRNVFINSFDLPNWKNEIGPEGIIKTEKIAKSNRDKVAKQTYLLTAVHKNAYFRRL